VALIDSFETDRPTLVCCALGYSRSAAAAAAWLVAKGRASSVDAAIASIQERRRKVVLTEAHRARLATWAQERGHL
jgi:protein-tyrosine phosphatase